MEVKALKAFITVAEELSFRRAADKLGMSQPPLTRLIAQLEDELNSKLFTRTTRSVELTGAGLHLLRKGRELLAQLAQTELEIRTLQKIKNGKLHLSLVGAALHSDLPRLVSSFKEQFPRFSVVLVETPLSSMIQSLRSAKVDMMIGASLYNEVGLSHVTIQSQELGLMMTKNHPLARKKNIRPLDLDAQTLIFHGKHERLGFQKEFLDYLENKGVVPQIYYKKSKESCGALVSAEKGLLLTTKKCAHLGPEIRFVPLTEFTPKLKIYATWANANPSLPLQAFINFLEERTLIPSSEMDGHLS